MHSLSCSELLLGFVEQRIFLEIFLVWCPLLAARNWEEPLEELSQNPVSGPHGGALCGGSQVVLHCVGAYTVQPESPAVKVCIVK